MSIRRKNLVCRHCGAPLPPGRLETCAPPADCGRLLAKAVLERRKRLNLARANGTLETQKVQRKKAARDRSERLAAVDRTIEARRQKLIDEGIANGYRRG
jgi:hypothetical protein